MTDLSEVDHHRFADRLNRLFEARHGAGAPELTDRQVATQITDAGTSISASYIWSLRNPGQSGKINPRFHHVEALAKFFGVPAGYFFDDNTQVEQELDLLLQLRGSGVRAVATRAAAMHPSDLQKLMAMMDIMGGVEPTRSDIRRDPGANHVR